MDSWIGFLGSGMPFAKMDFAISLASKGDPNHFSFFKTNTMLGFPLNLV
jgi:hypothetical protein